MVYLGLLQTVSQSGIKDRWFWFTFLGRLLATAINGLSDALIEDTGSIILEMTLLLLQMVQIIMSQ